MTLAEEAREYAALVAKMEKAESNIKELTSEQARVEKSLLKRTGVRKLDPGQAQAMDEYAKVIEPMLRPPVVKDDFNN
jgi:hypothetical protein